MQLFFGLKISATAAKLKHRFVIEDVEILNPYQLPIAKGLLKYL